MTKTITLQGTGCLPVTFNADRTFTASEELSGDKREVVITFHRVDPQGSGFRVEPDWYASLLYRTQWPTERDFERVIGPERIDLVVQKAQVQASAMLPPGAGYPATPAFKDRQLKLVGTLYTHAMAAMTAVLRDIYDDQRGSTGPFSKLPPPDPANFTVLPPKPKG